MGRSERGMEKCSARQASQNNPLKCSFKTQTGKCNGKRGREKREKYILSDL